MERAYHANTGEDLTDVWAWMHGYTCSIGITCTAEVSWWPSAHAWYRMARIWMSSKNEADSSSASRSVSMRCSAHMHQRRQHARGTHPQTSVGADARPTIICKAAENCKHDQRTHGHYAGARMDRSKGSAWGCPSPQTQCTALRRCLRPLGRTRPTPV